MHSRMRGAAPFTFRLRKVVAFVALWLALLPAAATPQSIAAPVPPDPKPSPTSGSSALAVAADSPAVPGVAPAATVSSAGPALWSCGASGGPEWTSFSEELTPIKSCELTVPSDGYVLLSASATGTLGGAQPGWVGNFRLGIDGQTDQLGQPGDDRTDRRLVMRADNRKATSKTVAATLLEPLAAGTHSFGFWGQAEAGLVRLSNPSLSVVFVPGSGTDITACGTAPGTPWETTSASYFQPIASCTLNLARNGHAYVVASGTASARNGAVNWYEGRFRVGGELGSQPQPSSDRWVNVYYTGRSIDETVYTSALLPVEAGVRTFHFFGYRYLPKDGGQPVIVSDPTLAVLFFPDSSLAAQTCGGSNPDRVSITSEAFATAVSCQIQVPQPALAFIDASATAALGSQDREREYEAQARLSVDGAGGLTDSERRFSIDADSVPEGDGTDRTVVTNILTPLAAGTHTVSLDVRLLNQSVSAGVLFPTINVFVPGNFRLYLPLLWK